MQAEPLEVVPRQALACLAVGDDASIQRSLLDLVHFADSEANRRQAMAEVAFPFDDVQMFLVVNQLALKGAMRPSDLAGVLQTSRPHFSRISKRLEDSGLVTKRPDPTDGRAQLLALSDSGAEIGGRIVEHGRRRLEYVIGEWQESEVAELRRLLRRLVTGLMHVPPTRPTEA